MRVSFDFDGVLDVEGVQDFARDLVRQGIDVYIVTNRPCDEDAPSPNWNVDLYGAANYVGIYKDRIEFLNMTGKVKFFEKNPDFIWHLEDDWTEALEITEDTDVIGIPFGRSQHWRNQCLDLINQKKS